MRVQAECMLMFFSSGISLGFEAHSSLGSYPQTYLKSSEQYLIDRHLHLHLSPVQRWHPSMEIPIIEQLHDEVFGFSESI